MGNSSASNESPVLHFVCFAAFNRIHDSRIYQRITMRDKIVSFDFIIGCKP